MVNKDEYNNLSTIQDNMNYFNAMKFRRHGSSQRPSIRHWSFDNLLQVTCLWPQRFEGEPRDYNPQTGPPPEQPLPNINPHPGGSAREGICPDTDVNYVYTSVSRTSV